MKKKFLAVLMSGLLILAASGIAQANLIVNGSFENNNGFVNNGQDTMVLNPLSNTMGGWTVVSNQLAWIGASNPFALSASNGTYFLDLTSYYDAGIYGGVTQTINTVAGATYQLSFDLGGSPQYGSSDSIQASAGSIINTYSINASINNQWNNETLNFTANDSSTVISLIGLSGGYYIGLDNVSVTQTGAAPVPEPGTMMLLGLGMAGLAVFGKRRMNRES
jgi:hypothetical protein